MGAGGGVGGAPLPAAQGAGSLPVHPILPPPSLLSPPQEGRDIKFLEQHPEKREAAEAYRKEVGLLPPVLPRARPPCPARTARAPSALLWARPCPPNTRCQVEEGKHGHHVTHGGGGAAHPTHHAGELR